MIFLLLLVLLSPLHSQSLMPDDFAGYMVLSGSAGALLRFEIPGEVYQGLLRPDRGDIRIFDAAGVMVPFLIRGVPPKEITPEPAEVPFFPWNGTEGKNLPSGTDIEINTSGGVVRIKNQNSVPGRNPVYLADLSGLAHTPSSLRLSLDHRGDYFNAPVTLYRGKELGEWQAFSRKQILAWYGNSGANRDTLELPAGEMGPKGAGGGIPYLLIAMEEGAPPLGRVTGLFDPLQVPGILRETVWEGEKSADAKFVHYRMEGRYPARTIDFVLGEPDSIPVMVKNRFNEGDDWILLGRETIFLFHGNGPPQKNAPLPLSAFAPLWELEAAGELSFSQVPRGVVTWAPEEIIFLARGEGPWTLRYGNSDAAPLSEASLDPASLSHGGEELSPALPTGEGGYEKRSPPPPAENHDYGQWILWGILSLGVAVLSILARSIAGSMKKTRSVK
ncbi:MAG: DUF3999 domain-containing protein [Treponema sp.]|jgi:hypothetical protein|nr:DUF3999 domain-containing protein [Treponema sp.]